MVPTYSTLPPFYLPVSTPLLQTWLQVQQLPQHSTACVIMQPWTLTRHAGRKDRCAQTVQGVRQTNTEEYTFQNKQTNKKSHKPRHTRLRTFPFLPRFKLLQLPHIHTVPLSLSLSLTRSLSLRPSLPHSLVSLLAPTLKAGRLAWQTESHKQTADCWAVQDGLQGEKERARWTERERRGVEISAICIYPKQGLTILSSFIAHADQTNCVW